MDVGFTEVLAGVGVLIAFLYYRSSVCYRFWKNLQVHGPKPIPIFGNSKEFLLGQTHMGLLFKKFYDDYKTEPYVGLYDRGLPLLLIRDLDLIKDVLIKDFIKFPNRGVMPKYTRDPLEKNLVNLEYDQWRPLRSNLTPAFTSGKLKDMFYLLAECAQNFEKFVAKIATKGKSIDCYELTAKYATDAIGMCGFGLNINAIDDENSEFRRCQNQLLEKNFKNITRLVVRELFPWIYERLRPFVYNRAEDFFVNTMKETMNCREKSKVRRNDFVDLLMDFKKQSNGKLEDMEITDVFLTAQALIFFIAGFESTGSTLSNALYELALNPSCQNKLRNEIRDVLAEDGKLTYDNVRNLKYLDKIFKETLRKYPPFTLMRRLSLTPYTFTGTELTIPKNIGVVIPIWAIHRDPNIWPDPDKFDPERFNDENEKMRHPMSYLPFGNGPRICIGYRFSDLEMKIGLIALINKFQVDVCDQTSIPYRIHPRGIIPKPLDPIPLKFTEI